MVVPERKETEDDAYGLGVFEATENLWALITIIDQLEDAKAKM